MKLSFVLGSMFLVEDLKMLRSRFPNTLKPEILHIYCAYAAACLWTKDVEVCSLLFMLFLGLRFMGCMLVLLLTVLNIGIIDLSYYFIFLGSKLS